VSCIAVTPDGRFLLAGTRHGYARVWQLRDGKEVASFKDHDREVTSLIVLKDGTAVSAGVDGVLRAWDPATGRSKNHITVGGSSVLTLALSGGDSPHILVGCEDGKAHLRKIDWLKDPRYRIDP
jgi:WD40 repeat protein